MNKMSLQTPLRKNSCIFIHLSSLKTIKIGAAFFVVSMYCKFKFEGNMDPLQIWSTLKILILTFATISSLLAANLIVMANLSSTVGLGGRDASNLRNVWTPTFTAYTCLVSHRDSWFSPKPHDNQQQTPLSVSLVSTVPTNIHTHTGMCF